MAQNFYGSYALILHSHIPYVLHHNRMDEEWLYEAVAETYIPLLNNLNRLVNEGISPKITIGLSPVLAEQLRDSYFVKEFIKYCQLKIDLADKDNRDFESKVDTDPTAKHLAWLALQWKTFYSDLLSNFEGLYENDLIGAFRKLQDDGHIEVITCGATHGYFPALSRDESIQFQVKTAINSYERMFERRPRGIWLPECGYRPGYTWSSPVGYPPDPYKRKGVEQFLSENDLEFFVLDTHQILNAWPPDIQKTSMETYFVGTEKIAKKPVSIFCRDINLSKQVWDHDGGYPGDGTYLDFHKKHGESKHRYWKITDKKVDMAFKDLYWPDDAFNNKVQMHAGHYKDFIKNSLQRNFDITGRSTVAVTAFDTELFGHWWFEGPTWLYYLIKWINQDPEINGTTCSGYLERESSRGYLHLPESSWGNNYDNSTWINPETHYVLRKIYESETAVKELHKRLKGKKLTKIMKRFVNQLLREFLILQASDWKFMITNWSTRDHAEARIVEHGSDFNRLLGIINKFLDKVTPTKEDQAFLRKCEKINSIFEDLDIGNFGELYKY